MAIRLRDLLLKEYPSKSLAMTICIIKCRKINICDVRLIKSENFNNEVWNTLRKLPVN
jgi:hypothetical protein